MKIIVGVKNPFNILSGKGNLFKNAELCLFDSASESMEYQSKTVTTLPSRVYYHKLMLLNDCGGERERNKVLETFKKALAQSLMMDYSELESSISCDVQSRFPAYGCGPQKYVVVVTFKKYVYKTLPLVVDKNWNLLPEELNSMTLFFLHNKCIPFHPVESDVITSYKNFSEHQMKTEQLEKWSNALKKFVENCSLYLVYVKIENI